MKGSVFAHPSVPHPSVLPFLHLSIHPSVFPSLLPSIRPSGSASSRQTPEDQSQASCSSSSFVSFSLSPLSSLLSNQGETAFEQINSQGGAPEGRTDRKCSGRALPVCLIPARRGIMREFDRQQQQQSS